VSTTSDHADDDLVSVPRSQLDALVSELRHVRTRLDALEAGPGSPPTTDGPTAPPRPPHGRVDEVDGRGALGRRAAIAGLMGATVGGIAAAAGARPAAAASGGNFILGRANGATDPTILDARNSDGNALWVRNNGTLGSGILSETTSAGAVLGYSTVSSTSAATGDFSNGSDGLALLATSDGPQLRLRSDTDTNPYTDPEFSSEGTVRASRNGELWFCVSYGTPGTWRKLAGRTTAGALHVLPTPARIYDSRPGNPPAVGSKTPLSGNAPRTLDLKVNSSGVPAGATAAVLTVLLVNAANGDGNLTVWAAGAARPQANTLVWGGSAGRFTTSTISALDGQARIQVAASASTNVVIDVVGYYR
jgi:hypothetical protein